MPYDGCRQVFGTTGDVLLFASSGTGAHGVGRGQPHPAG